MEKLFEVRDRRIKEKFDVDDKFLNGYARFLGIYSVGVYCSLARHVDKKQACFPSVNKIAEELGIGRNSVIESIKRLEFWNIIHKDRIGKKATNRYYLLDKKDWKPISEVLVKDYGEVCGINFRGLRDKLHVFATQTSIVRSTHSKVTQSKEGNKFPKKEFKKIEDLTGEELARISRGF